MTKRVALYLRVSSGEQTTANQQRELEAVVGRHGWQIVKVFEDAGISGRHGRDKRPGFDRLCRAAVRKEFDVVAAWSVDRLGRSLLDLLTFLGELHAKGVDLYLHQQGIDTTTPGGKAMFQMMGVFAEFERAIIVERVKAGPLVAPMPTTDPRVLEHFHDLPAVTHGDRFELALLVGGGLLVG